MTINMHYEDLNRTYGFTFVGIRDDEGHIEPFFVQECDSDNYLRGEFCNDTLEIDINDPSVVLDFPDSGVYNVSQDKAFFVSRSAERQWHRGIRERSLQFVGDESWGIRAVRAMMNPVYSTLEHALSMFDGSSNFKSQAINRNWWVRKQRNAKYPLIYFRERCVGEMREDEIYIPNPALKTLFMEVTGNV